MTTFNEGDEAEPQEPSDSEEDNGSQEPRGKERGAAYALDHPVRRDILRRYHACGCERSPIKLAEEMNIGLSRISYHVSVLSECDCLILMQSIALRGATEHVYKSTVEDDKAVLVVLEETEEEDAKARKQREAKQETLEGTAAS